MMFTPSNTIQGIGQTFHDLSEKIIHTLIKEEQFTTFLTQTLEKETIHQNIQNLLYELVFLPYLHTIKKNNPKKVDKLYPLWLGLKPLIFRLTENIIDNLPYCPSEKVIRKTLITQEYKLKYTLNLPNNTQQIITGRLDSLIFNFAQNRLSVVEYKTYHPVDPTAQFAQVALYSYMLSHNQGIPVNAIVYCVLPEFKEYNYQWEILEQKIFQLIPHKLQQMQTWLNWEKGQTSPPPPTPQPSLCQMCSQKTKCKQVFSNDLSP